MPRQEVDTSPQQQQKAPHMIHHFSALLCEHHETGIRVKVKVEEVVVRSINALGETLTHTMYKTMETDAGQPARPKSYGDHQGIPMQVDVLCNNEYITFNVIESW